MSAGRDRPGEAFAHRVAAGWRCGAWAAGAARPSREQPQRSWGAALPALCCCVSLQEPWRAAASAPSGWEGERERASLSAAAAGRLGVLDGNPSPRMGWGHLAWGRAGAGRCGDTRGVGGRAAPGRITAPPAPPAVCGLCPGQPRHRGRFLLGNCVLENDFLR